MSRSLALINTTIPPPLKPARDGPDARAHREDRVGRQRGDEMNLALSASQLFRRYLNEAYAVTRQHHSNLGRLMVTVGAIGLMQMLALPIVARRARDAGARPEITARPAATR